MWQCRMGGACILGVTLPALRCSVYLFTCFTGTKVQMLTPHAPSLGQKRCRDRGTAEPLAGGAMRGVGGGGAGRGAAGGGGWTLVLGVRRYSVYLLYWYKSTNTDRSCVGVSTACEGAS
jgi:hypothetical protein